VNVTLRNVLDLYACLRPCKSYPGTFTLFDNVDIVIVRENTEDLYAGIEFERGTPETEQITACIQKLSGNKIKPESGISIKPISTSGSQRISRFAFEYARTNKRRKVTAVHKANIMKYSDGLFLTIAREIAAGYPEIEFEDRIVDNMTMQMVKDPSQFDILLCPNLYGDILSDLGAGLIGGLGLAPGANIGDDIALFEPTHGSAPKYKGMNKVNPMAQMLSGVMMLKHIKEFQAAERLENAIAAVIAEGKNITYDLLPANSRHLAVGTAETASAIIDKMS
jgi:isocitrate dehydrogenase (NAD+)